MNTYKYVEGKTNKFLILKLFKIIFKDKPTKYKLKLRKNE